MTSAIYAGHVAHARFGAKRHRLRYKLFMLALDVDELPSLKLNLLKHNRPGLYAFHDRDHAGCIDAPLRPQIEANLRAAGIIFDGGPITLLTMPRLMGYVFNPISVYFCRRRSGDLAAIIYEVRNTFGERHDYVLPVTNAGIVRQSCEKAFFVSPFMEMGLHYEFRVGPPGEDVLIGMSVMRGDQLALTASFAGARQELNDANLARAFIGDPLMTLKAIFGIHWEALKMLAKGIPYLGRRRAQRPSASTPRIAPVSVATSSSDAMKAGVR